MSAVHCWEDGPYGADGWGSTCMLPDGHEGPHVFTPDDQIILTFGPLSAQPSASRDAPKEPNAE